MEGCERKHSAQGAKQLVSPIPCMEGAMVGGIVNGCRSGHALVVGRWDRLLMSKEP